MSRESREKFCDTSKDEDKQRVNVPCMGWMYSQNKGDQGDLKSPIIVWWVEGVAPSYTKRKVYYSFLDEVMSPLRTNVSRGMKRDSQVIQGFNVHSTNTCRYMLIIPKGEGNGGRRYPGRNLWQHYQVTSYIPSFISSEENWDALLDGGEEGPLPLSQEAKNNRDALVSIRGTSSEQALYRNIVIETCQSSDTGADQLLAPVCTTSADLLKVPVGVSQAAAALGWDLEVFLQYVVDNTVSNFEKVGRPNAIEAYAADILSVQYLLFAEKGYSYWIDPIFHLVNVKNPQFRIPILGLEPPVNSPPWM